jgi:hypothetical protein
MDHEFDKWCEKLLADGTVTSIEYLHILHSSRFIWEASRRLCANLCAQNGLKGMGMNIMRREDGSIDESWMELYQDA